MSGVTYDQSADEVSHPVRINVRLVGHLYQLRGGSALNEWALSEGGSFRNFLRINLLTRQASVLLLLFSLTAYFFSKRRCRKKNKLTASRDR